MCKPHLANYLEEIKFQLDLIVCQMVEHGRSVCKPHIHLGDTVGLSGMKNTLKTNKPQNQQLAGKQFYTNSYINV